MNSSKEYYVFSPWLRIFHWIMAYSVPILFFTGLYIGNPFFIGSQGIEPTYAFRQTLSMETIRYIHFITAYVFVGSFILRIYGFIMNKGDRLFPRFWTKEYWLGAKEVTLHYLFLLPQHKPYLRNPLARTSYVALYALIAIEIITGFAMYYMVNPDSWGAKIFGPWNDWLGGEYYVHLIHHYAAWMIMLSAIGHIYMVVRADFIEREGEISSMFSGVKFLRHEPVDLKEIADEAEERPDRVEQPGDASPAYSANKAAPATD
ncbi:Ni/Fe-hydrogenase, b-type cytochrome subunit [Acetonema longum]|uniref:Ni/Fe-hydrogenase, b-type cytochrome subunit n=1 Tax=Acetonema longum DSM 6540 TaxID=1009370 RepID=F7NIS2_9FIRM|nr:Ni/Fe-hydrogenase, b-type cytochrome subunit [Acetonema longum]EGO64045.1 Ni/Fe-hydrogenase, b-type cytochrome subunit [Acetonema longum DSM 6540]